MKIKVNGKDTEIAKEMSVKELFNVVEVKMPLYVTVQVNEEYVPKDNYETKIIKEGDSIEFLYFMGGGAK